ncbi:Cell division cycle 7-related protein kinase [Fagus crenata]
MREKGDLEFGNHFAKRDDLNLTTTTIESEQTWHFLALLLSLGRSVRPAELASRCTLFCASPTSSSPQRFHTFTFTGFHKFTEFMAEDVGTSALRQPHLAPPLASNLILAPPIIDNPSLVPPPPLSSI